MLTSSLIVLILLLVVVVWLLWEIHRKLIHIEIRMTETQTDLISPNERRVRFTGPNQDVTPMRTIFHDICDKLDQLIAK